MSPRMWMDGTNPDGTPCQPLAGADPSLAPPDGQIVLGLAMAKGVQIYQATGSPVSWQFVAPQAQLTEGGSTVGSHSQGPTWTADTDGSAVHGTVLKKGTGGSGNIQQADQRTEASFDTLASA